jgi:hypothetical protein
VGRWNGLRTSELGVFDYVGYPPVEDRDRLERSAAVKFAATSYELGVAMALGHPVLILSDNPKNIPFDIDSTLLTVSATRDLFESLSQAMDDVIYGVQRQTLGSSLKVTRTWLERVFHGHPFYSVSSPLATLESDDQNSVKFRYLAESILGWAGDTKAQILYPTWPGDYPDTSRPKLFHVMPFGPDWSSTVSKIVAMACQTFEKQVQYVRGDQLMTRDIIRSIWVEICTSTHILVDLTGLSANVAFELGIADTLGRSTLLVSQRPADDKRRVIGPALFPGLLKDRVHFYTLTSSPALQLPDLIRNFLLGAITTSF